MIGGSNNINSYSTHTHEHMVTKCLHEDHALKPGGDGPVSGAVKSAVMQEMQKQETFSIKEILTDGLKSLFSRTSGLLGNIWNTGGKEDGTGQSGDKAVWTEADRIAGQQGVVTGAIQQPAAENTATGVLSTAVARTVDERKKTIHEESMERKVSNVEDSVNGGLKKDQGEVKKFLQKFGETVTRTGRLFRKESETETEVSLSENNSDFGVGDSSYLLDSYNKSGEYSTLAKDRSLEGNFKAKG